MSASAHHGFQRRLDPAPERVIQTERPKYTATGLPAITPLLKKLGLVAWCTQSEPDLDCTGRKRLSRYNAHFLRADDSPSSKRHNKQLADHRRALQKIAFELYDHYLELRVADIGFIMGYSSSFVDNIKKWIPPQGY